jgi:hypothetical protein
MPHPRSARRLRRVSAVISTAGLLTVGMLAVGGPAAGAATPYSSTAVIASVSARTVTATVTIKANPAVTATVAGVCARNSGGGVVDFPHKSSVQLTTTGTQLTESRTLSPGTYTFWGCAYISGKWYNIGARSAFTIANTISGEAMPVGNLPGWQQRFSDDFSTPVALGKFPGPYAAKWTGYDGGPDASGDGVFAQKILSVHDGMLDMYLHSENGKALGAAPTPNITGTEWEGQVYGRYSVRFKTDSLARYGTGWVLWPDSNNWNEGEIDFPEGSLNNWVTAFVHCIGHGQDNCTWLYSSVKFAPAWHTATIDWKPGSVSFYMDNILLITNTTDVPTTKMHWILQTATNGGAPAATTAGHLMIDWAVAYSWTG